MFVLTLDVLGWGRGGFQGAGSSVVGVGEEIVPWDDPMGLTDVGSVGGFDSWGVENRPAYLLVFIGGRGERSLAFLLGRMDDGL